MCWCVSLCCTMYRFISASLPEPVNGSSAFIPSGTSTSASGCSPSSTRPSKNSRPEMAKRPRRASLEHAHNPISPIGSGGSLPPHSTVPEEESPGSNDRKTFRRNRSAKPWSPSAVRGRRSEPNLRIACDCRHLQPRPGPSHHGLTEQLRAANIPNGPVDSCLIGGI